MRIAAASLLLLAVALSPCGAQAPAAVTYPAAAATPATAASAPAGATPAAAATPATAPVTTTSPPADTSRDWKVGFTVFTAEDLSPENAYLASSIPLLLRHDVSGLSEHSFPAEERDAVRRAIVGKAQDAADLALTAARRERDALLFVGPMVTDAAKKAAEDRLKSALEREAFLQSFDPALIEVVEEKPVTLAEGTGQGKLLDAPRVPAAAYCARQGLDLLVGGTIREVQGYLLVDVWAFHAARGEVVVSARDAARREELYDGLPAIGAELTGAILGRDWSVVRFAPRPAESSLFVDGVLAASGASPALYLDPGTREIRVSAPGYEDATRTLSLEKNGTTLVDDALRQSRPGTIAVMTDPAGAALYVDSRRLGVTPLTIDTPAQRSRAVLELGGYYPLALSLGPDSAGELSYTLPPDVGPRDVRQQKARGDFYAAFGWFALSIPIPLFSYALVFDFAVQQQDFLRAGRTAEADQAAASGRDFLIGYYGGVGLSTALFALMVWRIIEYVTVAGGIAG